MNIAIITAGGVGQRMNARTLPKQFLKLHDKPILIYTIEKFQCHKNIDTIILVCLNEYISYCKELLMQYQLDKVTDIVSGGENGFESIHFGLEVARQKYSEDSIVLIHDGVRPLIDEDTISKTIQCTEEYRNAITVCSATETIAFDSGTGVIDCVLDRKKCKLARAPQCFILSDIWKAHQDAIEKGLFEFVDSSDLMIKAGYSLHMVEGPVENIKITTPADFYIFRAMIDAKENSQIFG